MLRSAVGAEEVVVHCARRAGLAAGVMAGVVVFALGGVAALGDSTRGADVATATGADAGGDFVAEGQAAGAWREMHASPLGPRYDAQAVWTGTEMLVIGGRAVAREGGPAPRPQEFPRAVAAYDPQRDRWRTLESAPFYPASISVASWGRSVYVLDGQEYLKPRLWVYDLDADSWRELTRPPAAVGPSQVAILEASGTKLFAWFPYTRGGEPGDLIYDTLTDTWSRARPNPLGDTLNREVVALERGRVVSIGMPSVPWYGSRPLFYEAAVLDLTTGRWRRLPKAPFILGDGALWQAVADDQVVNLAPGRSDGYAKREVKRTYPIGGRLDVADGSWHRLPPRPKGAEILGNYYWATAAGGDVAILQGWALNLRTGVWTKLPKIPGMAELDSAAVVWTGDRLLAWGGRPNDGKQEGGTTARGWMWTPPTREPISAD